MKRLRRLKGLSAFSFYPLSLLPCLLRLKSRGGGAPRFLKQDGKTRMESTREHVFIMMLASILVRYLHQTREGLNITVPEGETYLSQLSSIKVTVNKKGQCFKEPSGIGKAKSLLEAISGSLPEVLSARKYRVITRKKLFK